VNFFPLVAFIRYFIYNKPKSNLHSAITTLNTTEKAVFFLSLSFTHTQNTNALQPDVFLPWVQRLPFTKKRRLAFSSANNCKVICKLLSQC